MNQHTFKRWAKSISPDVLEFINGMFNGVNVEQIRYRACLSLQKLSGSNLNAFLEAIKICNESKVYTFKACNDIFKELIKKPQIITETPIKNDNIRGRGYYMNGGLSNV